MSTSVANRFAEAPHTATLKRAGIVLVVAGLLDICVLIYSIVSRIPYSSSISVFAVIGGVFLLRGSLQAASHVQWFALLIAAALISMLVVSPALQPTDLTLTEIRLHPHVALVGITLFVFTMALLIWLVKELGSPQVRAARAAAGQKERSARMPIAVGICLALAFATVSVLVQRSDAAIKAIEVVGAANGPEYRYHVSSLNYRGSNQGKSVSGIVTAWNKYEIKNVPFRWED
ncbi:hypothetical protein [Variovorax boronicumulans]|uniref:hypothetical protein n=1 Tax=Variovorax boronicumulans TaxID=436515 RepID=UPI0033954B59